MNDFTKTEAQIQSITNKKIQIYSVIYNFRCILLNGLKEFLNSFSRNYIAKSDRVISCDIQTTFYYGQFETRKGDKISLRIRHRA